MMPHLKIMPLLARLTLCLVMLASSMLPYSAAAAGGDIKLSRFICNLSPVTAAPQDMDAQTAIADLLRAAGKRPSEDDGSDASEHCDNCVLPLHVYGAPASTLVTRQISVCPSPLYPHGYDGYYFSAQGPPLGGRAPPQSL